MPSYEVIAFYKEDRQSVEKHAEKLAGLYGLSLRYEKLPELETGISALLADHTVLCLFNRDEMKIRKVFKYVYHINKPALIFSNAYSTDAYNSLKVPVGYLQENKEKVVWANFFQRHNPQSRIELIIPEEKDENISRMVNDNVCFIENIFHNSGAIYEKTFLPYSFERILTHVFQARQEAVIFLMRPFRVFSFYIPYNFRLYCRYAHTQILIIPRDDELYIPCH